MKEATTIFRFMITLVIGVILSFLIGCTASTENVDTDEVVEIVTPLVEPTNEFQPPAPITDTHDESSPTLIPVPTPAQTSKPTLTPEPIPTENLAESTIDLDDSLPDINTLNGPILAMIQLQNELNQIHLVDIASQRLFTSQFKSNPLRLNWLMESCILAATVRNRDDASVSIVNVENNNEVLFLAQNTVRNNTEDGYEDGWQLSPNGNLAAYLVLSGEQYFAYSEFQNLEVVAVDPSNSAPTPINTSSNNGVLSFSWSPDGNYIAYSDFDEHNVRQLYIYEIETGQIIQLASFVDAGAMIGEPIGNFIGQPIWSITGELIVFEAGITKEDGSVDRSLWAVNLDDFQISQLLAESNTHISIMGISLNDNTIAVYMSDGNNTSNLLWIDVPFGNVVQELEAGKVPNTNIKLVAALIGVNSWLGEDSDGQLYLYDHSTLNVDTIPGINLPRKGLIFELNSPRGEAAFVGQILDWRIFAPCQQ
ncbi:MAG: PD40 domain-containing protein [Ardenticatenaceae bacterium]|nr:PD40 domain-containing protein [Ardenticatenaceae bacterium]MCB9002924.1 PD40 domain-containing protein [Ardenticatenaceae bacterium]